MLRIGQVVWFFKDGGTGLGPVFCAFDSYGWQPNRYRGVVALPPKAVLEFQLGARTIAREVGQSPNFPEMIDLCIVALP